MENEHFFNTNDLCENPDSCLFSKFRNENFAYNLRELNGKIQFFCEYKENRLTKSEIITLLASNEKSKFLKEEDLNLLNYLIHKLNHIQSIYQLLGDLDILFSFLKETNFKILFNEIPIKFEKENYKLDFECFLDEDSNVVLKRENKGELFLGLKKAYFLSENKFYCLSSKIPLTFYKQINERKNLFTINKFLEIKDTFFKLLKEEHNLNSSDEVQKITDNMISEKTAPLVLEIGKSAHFISVTLKYKIGHELFNPKEYSYYETSNWPSSKKEIKSLKEKNELIEYQSDENLSEHFFEEHLGFAALRYVKKTNPFELLIPISAMEVAQKIFLPKLEKAVEIIYKEGVSLEITKEKVIFEIENNLNRSKDLFEFNLTILIDNEKVSLSELKTLLSQNKKIMQLKKNKTVNITNIREITKWVEFLSKFDFNQRAKGKYIGKTVLALEFDEFLEQCSDKKVVSNQEYVDLIMELKEKKPVEEIALTNKISSTLRQYQKEGVYWMHFLKKYGFGGILADEMGLGKTIQALTLLSLNKGPHLVICPKSLIYNWDAEIQKYFPKMKVLIIDKDSFSREKQIREYQHYDVVITSYSLLLKDYQHYLNNKVQFCYQILDEAHYVKNMKTLSSKAVRLIASDNTILLTGTPIENNLEELYGTFELVMPGYLGNITEFRKNFVAKIERNNKLALELLHTKVRPFILRRTKEQVLPELPEKQEQIVYNTMTQKQSLAYFELLSRVKEEIHSLVEKQGFERSRIQILTALLKLRQICNHPALLDSSFKDESKISGKYEQFKELLSGIIENEEKVLVFSQFTSQLDIIENDLKKQNTKYLRLDGSTNNRQELVNKFQNDPEVSVFLISLKAGGVGLNLTAATSVFLYDPWWNPMVEKQAIDRAHRIGQKKTVNIYKFITKNSIEEKILKIQERKGNLFDNVISEDSGFIKKLEWEDLIELFE